MAEWKDEQVVKKAIAETFTLNAHAGWILVGYSGDNALVFQGKGSGGVEELKQHLKPNEVQYAIVRIGDKKDVATTTRDILLSWWGPEHSKIKSAKKKTHHGDVKRVLTHAHAEIEVINLANLNEDNVRDRSNPLSGSHVID
eukprot:TRINITY_DN806_c0_g1_i1.p1 TRINITY_DN806_c0_g1~~TRINITY_DN806_c0_g1_i1.p1  ORF type:complete len:142 (+),score=58.41 TRINITY_DN806_c0_g1_i1:47-472(+)